MSEVWLVLAIGCLFFAIVLVGVFVFASFHLYEAFRYTQVAKRITPIDTRDRIAKKLVLAGSPAGWDAERVLAFKIIGAVAGFVGGILVLNLVDQYALVRLSIVNCLCFWVM